MSFAASLSEIVSQEFPADGPSLAAAVRGHDRYEARMCMSVGEFDAMGLWDVAGFTSTHAWLQRQGMHSPDAWDMVKLARKLRRLPTTAAAWVDGVLSGGQVRIIAGLVIDRHMRLFAEHEAELVPTLSDLTLDETRRVMRYWRDMADAINPGPN
ncbi:MAG: DUF222 domain-containing protein, partial [Acidimicrobiales bacterium]|nr:DUF222 domain-containing protein [Acidimicrobiales bacterium]